MSTHIRCAITTLVAGAVLLGCAGLVAPPASSDPASRAKSVPVPDARVDINHASLDELLKVPGLTRSWAERIVRFRPYRSKVDLVEHGVLPSDVYDRIKDLVIAHRGDE